MLSRIRALVLCFAILVSGEAAFAVCYSALSTCDNLENAVNRLAGYRFAVLKRQLDSGSVSLNANETNVDGDVTNVTAYLEGKKQQFCSEAAALRHACLDCNQARPFQCVLGYTFTYSDANVVASGTLLLVLLASILPW